jgi:hypothetical protein
VTIIKREWYFHKNQIHIWDIRPVKQNREPRNKNIWSCQENSWKQVISSINVSEKTMHI